MKTILVVDDSPTARASIQYALKKHGYGLLLAEDGVKAIETLKSTNDSIDLMLFDVNMPNMDGITLISEVRKLEKWKFTPILILTTESQESKKMEGKKAGASGWIVKPFDPDQLTAVIQRFVKE